MLGPVCPKGSDVWDALQVLCDRIRISQNGEDIQQKFNALIAVIYEDVTAKLTQCDIRTYFQ